MNSRSNNEYYTRLELNSESTKDDIKRAYRKQALRYHPDKIVQLQPNEINQVDQFKSIKEAYETLIDDNKRELYDLYGPKVLSWMIKSGIDLKVFLSIFNVFWYSSLLLSLITAFFVLLSIISYNKSYYIVVWIPIYFIDLLAIYLLIRAYQLINAHQTETKYPKSIALFVILGMYMSIHIVIHIAIPTISLPATRHSLLFVFIPLFLLEVIHLLVNITRFVADVKAFGKEDDDLISRLTGEKYINQMTILKIIKLCIDHFWLRTIVIIQEVFLYLRIADIGLFHQLSWWIVFIPAFSLMFSLLLSFFVFYFRGKTAINKLNIAQDGEQMKGFMITVTIFGIFIFCLLVYYYSTLIMLIFTLLSDHFSLVYALIPTFILLACMLCCCACCCPCLLKAYLHLASQDDAELLPTFVASDKRLRN